MTKQNGFLTWLVLLNYDKKQLSLKKASEKKGGYKHANN